MTIEEAIKKSHTLNISKGSSKLAQKMLLDNETLLYAFNANVSTVPIAETLNTNNFNLKNKINGIVAITDKRIFFCSNILFKKTSKEIYLDKISSIDDKSNSLIGLGQLRIQCLTEMFVVDCKSKNIDEIKNIINSARTNTTTN